MKKQNKILITGGFGFIGTNLINHLLDQNYEVAIIDNSKNTKFKNVIKYIGDISDYSFVLKSILDCQPNFVFHLAGFKERSSKVEDINISLQSNLIGSLNIYQSLLKISCLKSIVTLGTADEYGINKSLFKESSIESPISPYGFSKLCNTKLAAFFYQNYNLPISVLRPTVAFGPHQGLDMFIPSLIQSLILNKEFKMTSGNQTRDFIYISDLIDIMIIISQSEKSNGQIYNVGSGIKLKLCEVAKSIAKDLKKESYLKVGAIPYRKNEVMDYSVCIEKIQTNFNWKPKVDFKKGIELTTNYFKNNA